MRTIGISSIPTGDYNLDLPTIPGSDKLILMPMKPIGLTARGDQEAHPTGAQHGAPINMDIPFIFPNGIPSMINQYARII